MRKLTWAFGAVGIGAALLGLVIGIAMADHQVVVACSRGEVAINGCSSYPRLGLGAAVALLSAAIGALIVLACTGLLLMTRGRRLF